MQQLIPDLRTVDDPAVLIAADDRHPPAGRPWVMANMVMSIDGAYSRDGRSAGLSGDADRAMFAALRTLADVVLVAAGTARAERYRRPAAVPGHGSARLAVVTRSARIPDDQPFLSGEGPDPIVFHPSDADTSSVPSGVELKTYSTQDEANNDLAAGRLDYVLANSSALYDFLDTDQGKGCCELKSIVDKPKDDPGIYGEGVGAGVRKEDTALRDKLNAAITAMAKAGKFDEITAKYPQLVGKMTLPKAN